MVGKVPNTYDELLDLAKKVDNNKDYLHLLDNI